MRLRALLCTLLLPVAAAAAAQDIPSDGLHCGLKAPPEAAAKGIGALHRNPMRLFPVNPGAQYTGCQWVWIAYGTPTSTWDYSSVTYYEGGVPRIQRVRYPPLPVQSTIQTCVYDADGRAQKVVEGNDWQHDCHSARQLQELLRVTPRENDWWNFF